LRFEVVSRRSSLEQLLPPLLLAGPLLATRGTTLLLGEVAVLAAFSWSAARLLRLARKKDRGARRLRSLLVVGLAPVVVGLGWMQALPVPNYLNGLADQLQRQCRTAGSCPGRIAAWPEAAGPTGSTGEMGGRVRYAIAYRTDGQRFTLCWQVAFDRCRSAEGGVAVPLRRMAARPWPELGGERAR
jgi:hypothetical protein